jgi:hypothetical protein
LPSYGSAKSCTLTGTERLRREIDDLGLHAIDIDIDMGTTEEELITHVAEVFGLRT